MALSEFETKRVEKMVAQFVEKHRPPQNIRNKLDLAFRVEGQSVEIFEVRPVWREPNKKNGVRGCEGDICQDSTHLEGLLATGRS